METTIESLRSQVTSLQQRVMLSPGASLPLHPSEPPIHMPAYSAPTLNQYVTKSEMNASNVNAAVIGNQLFQQQRNLLLTTESDEFTPMRPSSPTNTLDSMPSTLKSTI